MREDRPEDKLGVCATKNWDELLEVCFEKQKPVPRVLLEYLHGVLGIKALKTILCV